MRVPDAAASKRDHKREGGLNVFLKKDGQSGGIMSLAKRTYRGDDGLRPICSSRSIQVPWCCPSIVRYPPLRLLDLLPFSVAVTLDMVEDGA